jgi:IMP dehydrogenase
MASSEVQDDYHGGMAEWRTAEGVSTEVPFSHNEDAIIADIVGGLRSGMTYAGASTIKELQRKLVYVKITPAGKACRTGPFSSHRA